MEDKQAEKAGEYPILFIYALSHMVPSHLPALPATREAHLQPVQLWSWQHLPDVDHPPPCFSKSPGDPWPPATAPPFTHFTPPIPHMNNTSSDSLHRVNESIASRASETPRPLHQAPPPLLALYSPPDVHGADDELWVAIPRPSSAVSPH